MSRRAFQKRQQELSKLSPEPAESHSETPLEESSDSEEFIQVNKPSLFNLAWIVLLD